MIVISERETMWLNTHGDQKLCDCQVESLTGWVEKDIVGGNLHECNCVMFDTRFCKDAYG